MLNIAGTCTVAVSPAKVVAQDLPRICSSCHSAIRAIHPVRDSQTRYLRGFRCKSIVGLSTVNPAMTLLTIISVATPSVTLMIEANANVARAQSIATKEAVCTSAIPLANFQTVTCFSREDAQPILNAITPPVVTRGTESRLESSENWSTASPDRSMPTPNPPAGGMPCRRGADEIVIHLGHRFLVRQTGQLRLEQLLPAGPGSFSSV
jgi:hypothetical protein